MTYRYEIESDAPLVLFQGIGNRPTLVASQYEQLAVGDEHELADKEWGHRVKVRRVE